MEGDKSGNFFSNKNHLGCFKINSGNFLFSNKTHLGCFPQKTSIRKKTDDVFMIWMFPKIGVPQNGWFTMEYPIKIDDLGG